MSKSLLIDHTPFQSAKLTLVEGKGAKPGLVELVGKLQAADQENGNNRKYPFKVLKREVDKYLEGPVKTRTALGELDHPESSVINLKNVCHNIQKLWWDGDDLMGEIEVLPTPSGNILKELFINNITVGISSRGMGSVKPLGEGTVEVQDDFELLCWDFVSNPSTYGAFMSPVTMNESVNVEMKKQIEECGKWCRAQDLMREIIIELN